MFDIDFAKNFENDFQEVLNNIDQNSFEFSYGLDDYARYLGTVFNMDIRNYADLTDLANATHNANWSVEEYTSAYSGHLEVVKQLQSGDLSSFDAGQIAGQFADTLQEVANTVAAASAAGVSVDLEAVAQGAGYDSFAAAVAAYNEQYGTSYTVDQAREALGQ